MGTIYSAVAIFSMAVIVGIYLLMLVLEGKKTPVLASFIHGTFALIGLLLLAIYSFTSNIDPIISLIAFGMAAISGLTLMYKHVTSKRVPKWLAITHAITAVTGYIFLILYAFF